MLMIRSRPLRSVIRTVIPLFVIPVLAFCGAAVFDRRRHMIISMAIAVFSLFLFAAGYEKRSTGTRRMVIAAVMTALCFVGRFIPVFEPVTALIILSALYLGREAGFLVGALTALLTNFYFGQGPWTAFQMLSWGLIGLGAGLLAQPLLKNRVLLLVYGAVAGFAYSLMMDIWTVLSYAGHFDLVLYLGAVMAAIPSTVSYILSNILFLALLARPIGQKLGRIKQKYAI